MTSRELLQMADEAGITFVIKQGVASATEEWLTTLARLIEKKVKKECAEICKNVVEDYRGTKRGRCAESVGDACASAILNSGDQL
jgi:hypothetical protein